MPLVVFELKVQRDDKGALTALVSEFDRADAASKKAAASHSSYSGVLTALDGQWSKATSSMAGMTGGFGEVAAAAGPAGLAVAAAGAAVVGLAGGMAALVSKFASASDSLTEMAARTGMSTTALQEFRNTAGVSLDTISGAIGKMQAKLGAGDDAFRRLGLSVNELIGMDPDQAFRAVAAAISSIENPTRRSAAAMDILGKGAAEQLPFIVDNMGKARERAYELGGVIGTDTVAAGARLQSALDDVSYAFDNVLKQMGAAIGNSPELISAIEGIAGAIGRVATAVGNPDSPLWKFLSAINPAPGLGGAFLSGLNTIFPGSSGQSVGGFVGKGGQIGGGGAYVTDAEKKVSDERKKQAKKLEDDIFQYRLGVNKLATREADAFYKELERQASANAKKLLDNLQKLEEKRKERLSYELERLDLEVQAERDAAELEEELAGDRAAAFEEEMERKRQAAEKLAGTFGTVGRAVDDLGALFLAMGVSADSGIMQVVSGLSRGLETARQITLAKTNSEKALLAGEAAIDIWSTNATNRSGSKAALSGAAQGAMVGMAFAPMTGGASIVVGAIAGALIGYFAGAGWRKVTKEAARVLGQDVSDELMKSIQKTQNDLGLGLTGAALLNLSKAMQESQRGASAFAPQMLELLDMVRSGAVPAAAGMDALADAFSRFAGEVNKSGQLASQGFVDVMRSARAMGQDIPGLKEWTKKWLDQAAGAMAGITGLLDGGKLVGGLDIATEEQAAASATVFSAVFWAQVKEQGFLVAADSMGPSFEALKKRIEDAFGPELADKLLGGMGRIFAIIGDNPAARAALQGIDAVQKALEGLANAGYLTQDAFAAFETTIAAGVEQEVAAGLTRKEALEASAPALARIIEAHQKYGFVIDEATQKLIDEAKANGIAFPTDPVYAMVDAIHELINAIRTANGLPPIDWASRSAAAAPPSEGDSAGAPNRPPRGGEEGFARGGIARGPASGHWELLHGDEMILPLRRREDGDPGGNGGPGGGGPPPGSWTLPGGGTIPPGPWGGGSGTVTPDTVAGIAAAVAAQVAAQSAPVVVQSSTPITIQETPLGREGRQEMRDESVRSIKDALWAHDQDLEDLIRRIPGRD